MIPQARKGKDEVDPKPNFSSGHLLPANMVPTKDGWEGRMELLKVADVFPQTLHQDS